MSSLASLTLPTSKDSTVRVSLIHAGRTTVPTAFLVQKQIPGHDLIDIPCYSFLIENEQLGKKVLYDLGIMKAWKEKQPPAIMERIKFAKAVMDITHDVADQLIAASVPLSSINSIIWSHHHMDHNGDPSLWPKSTSLVVGPGFKSNPHTYPGFPNNPDSVVCQDALEGRDLIELEFGDTLEIGGFKAVDFFGDGSFYLLQASGHTHDHICGLARTSENKFIFMGGDTAHHGGEFRPTRFLPLPEYITPSPFEAPNSRGVCPGAFFEPIHPSSVTSSGNYRTTPFYELSPMMNDFLPDARATVSKMQLFDASPDVFVIIAHDASLLDVLPFYPKGDLTGWEKTGDKTVGRWRFLKDFCKAVELLKAEGNLDVPEL